MPGGRKRDRRENAGSKADDDAPVLKRQRPQVEAVAVPVQTRAAAAAAAATWTTAAQAGGEVARAALGGGAAPDIAEKVRV